jgi:hypothetical protein
MIHYHGMAGTGTLNAIQLAAGRHLFISFARPNVLEMVSKVCSTFAVDNGAFSAWKSGNKLDYEGFVEFIKHWSRHPAFDWAVIPDVIDGSEEENDEYIARWPWQQLGRGVGVPVWHFHESLERLDRLASQFHRVALGSSGDYERVGTKLWWERMEQVMDVVCDDQGRPRTKLHGLRMLNPKVFSRLPLSSADSTNAEYNSMFDKSYMPKTKGQRAAVIAWRVEGTQSAETWSPASQMELALA